MSDEITVEVSLSYNRIGIDVVTRSNPTVGGDVITQKTSDARYVNRVQNIGAAAEALGLGDVTTPGWCWMRNIGTTEDIEIRAGVGGADVVKMEPGEWALFRFSTSTPYAISTAGGSDLEYFIIDD